MQITRKDVYWNYAATFLKIASSALLLPFILRMMPAETVGIWTVFITITAFGSLLDFGFSSTFTRNVTYVFSGVRSLKTTGFETVTDKTLEVDYGLLKSVIYSMRWLYFRMAAILFLLLITVGTWYVFSILKSYKGNTTEVYIAWGLLCLINSYNIFTLYYDSLLQGKGLIKKSKQIIIVGNLIYFIVAAVLVMTGKGLVAIVSAQASSVILIRWLSYRTFFTPHIKESLNLAAPKEKSEILKAIAPNAIKIGLTSLGGFMVQRSALVIGSLYLTLEQIASYGITMQLIGIISALSGIFTSTYTPKISQLRVELNNMRIKDIYLKGQFILIITYIFSSFGLLMFGEWGIELIGSQTKLMSKPLIILSLILSFEQANLIIAAGILLSKNEVPFFKASIISGVSIVIGLLVFFHFFQWGLLIMILVPLIVDFSYQTWKWPLEVTKELNITLNEVLSIIKIKK